MNIFKFLADAQLNLESASQKIELSDEATVLSNSALCHQRKLCSSLTQTRILLANIFYVPRYIHRYHVQSFGGICHCILIGSLRHVLLTNSHSGKSNAKSFSWSKCIWSFSVSDTDKYLFPGTGTHAQLIPSTDKPSFSVLQLVHPATLLQIFLNYEVIIGTNYKSEGSVRWPLPFYTYNYCTFDL